MRKTRKHLIAEKHLIGMVFVLLTHVYIEPIWLSYLGHVSVTEKVYNIGDLGFELI